MFFAGVADQALDIQFLAKPCIQFAETNFDLAAKFRERIDAFEEFAPKLFLRSLGETCRLRKGQFEYLHHGANIAYCIAASHAFGVGLGVPQQQAAAHHRHDDNEHIAEHRDLDDAGEDAR